MWTAQAADTYTISLACFPPPSFSCSFTHSDPVPDRRSARESRIYHIAGCRPAHKPRALATTLAELSHCAATLPSSTIPASDSDNEAPLTKIFLWKLKACLLQTTANERE